MDKSTLRRATMKALADLSRCVRETESDIVVETVLASSWYQNARNISVYLSTPLEISTNKIIKDMFAKNKTCFVPHYTKSVMEMVRVDSLAELEAMPLTKWGIRQPADISHAVMALRDAPLDLILAPGVAFTEAGGRLGHGKAFYDRYLGRCAEYAAAQGLPRPVVVGLAHSCQVLDSLPLDPWDVPLDHVIAPPRTPAVPSTR
eukprot:m.175981 g.175981  ORF g.175981 m.175981 type:complete len:204 (-) comp15337_c8_seq1:22-633(-)